MTTCPAALHNYNGAMDRMFDHDCVREVGHAGYHECSRHHRDTDQGCTWITGRFVVDPVTAMEPE